ncbi:ABC transporter ATP-binding protein [Muribaculaceae bacterium Isolate-039 (Harlan)]|jgi:lipoprotein-releasing system ATP-binding protein|uniref:ABC transporter ATP-binding protein n=1 Tax=Duncaniella TaxID=2518495 RepID=UPI000F481A58|nr:MULTISPECIES: ABC transporter ATP-binding protein [Duncaniella]NBH91319.1 ABC transporter ATP-binding protein [Muribaculaceae bacterium S4]NBI19643.1 ABC transporter ATP-binding protein [Muribaculaceae bacterium Z1]ROS90107.1 ABC transporter ATP-binding protein [Muribaculaceae bacterium Isolate-039 (Harlan)]ROS99432.1 ABC transporter ATP-binding protein [Muribaculaceae bacterium Isolate-077 (Janvier)]ROS99767.1 ABC transporter ATP-binding protein [Muribaculaceae bacterium Isolate-083 (Janvi
MIQVNDICKSFDKLQVLKSVSLSIADGEMLTIVGPSGAGKTTLLQIIGSLERPDSGSVIFDGEDITRLKDSRLAAFRNRNMGFVFQFHQLLPEFTLEENVALPALIGGTARGEAIAHARKLLNDFGLGSRLDHRPAQLSGGERQRAAVARALINDPKVILADEPTGSLDSHNRAELYRLFFDLRQATGKTFIIVTHDDTLALSSDRVIRMNDGNIIEDSAQ